MTQNNGNNINNNNNRASHPNNRNNSGAQSNGNAGSSNAGTNNASGGNNRSSGHPNSNNPNHHNSGNPNNNQRRDFHQRKENAPRPAFRKNNRNEFHNGTPQKYNSENLVARIANPKREESVEDIRMDIEKLEKDIQFEVKQIRSVKLGL